jgi:PAS domain S-box-containing protein
MIHSLAEIIALVLSNARLFEALGKSEKLFRGVIEQANDGITIVDARGTIIEWNRGQAQITGVPREMAVGKPLWEIQFQFALDEHKQVPGAYERTRQQVLDFVSTAPPPWANRLIEQEIQRADKTRCFIQTTTFQIKTEMGLYVGSVMRDITERKHAEEALAQSEEKFKASGSREGVSNVLVLKGSILVDKNLLNEAQNDPLLRRYDTIIVDEAHNLPWYSRELESASLSEISLKLAEKELDEFGDPEIADGISLRDFVMMTSDLLEKVYVSLVRDIPAAGQYPCRRQAKPLFTGMAHLPASLPRSARMAWSLFNRFYQPDFDLEALEVVPNLELSTSSELRLPCAGLHCFMGTSMLTLR